MWPRIEVIVVTKQSEAESIFGRGWTSEGFRRIRRRRRRFELYVLRTWDDRHLEAGKTVEIDNHAKLMIVDDRFLTVGSANINDRSFEYEDEINLAVVDPDWVRTQRLRLWREHLHDDPRLTGDIRDDARVWRDHARINPRFERGEIGRPISRVWAFRPPRDTPDFLDRGVS